MAHDEWKSGFNSPDGFDNEFSRNIITYSRLANSFLLNESHKKNFSDSISHFMKKYGVGESEYGKIMDECGRIVTNHRLYGHHIIYDFPYSSPGNIPDFLLHELSDIFTNFGLPILPGKLLENTPIYNYCKSISNSPNWNMINGFDILSATVSIFQGCVALKKITKEEYIVQTFADFAKTIGVGVFEFALALSHANPFLLLGAVLNIAVGIKGGMTSFGKIYFSRVARRYEIGFYSEQWKIRACTNKFEINNIADSFEIRNMSSKWEI